MKIWRTGVRKDKDIPNHKSLKLDFCVFSLRYALEDRLCFYASRVLPNSGITNVNAMPVLSSPGLITRTQHYLY